MTSFSTFKAFSKCFRYGWLFFLIGTISILELLLPIIFGCYLFLWNVLEDYFPLNLDIHIFLGEVTCFSGFSFSLSEEVLIELLEAVWTSKTARFLDVGEEMIGFFFLELLEAFLASKVTSLLDKVVSSEGVTSSFFTSSFIFCKQISKAVWSLDLRPAWLKAFLGLD